MDARLQFDYYYGVESEQFAFLMVPRFLIQDERFCNLSFEADRLLGAGCPICERERMNALPLEMIRYYSAKASLDCRITDEEPIGIPLQVYYPDISSVIEISPLLQRSSRKWENAKNWLCINAGIRLVRILNVKDEEYTNCICITREDDSEGTLAVAVSEAFRQFGIPVIIDMKDWLFYHNDAVLE